MTVAYQFVPSPHNVQTACNGHLLRSELRLNKLKKINLNFKNSHKLYMKNHRIDPLLTYIHNKACAIKNLFISSNMFWLQTISILLCVKTESSSNYIFLVTDVAFLFPVMWNLFRHKCVFDVELPDDRAKIPNKKRCQKDKQLWQRSI